MAGSPDSLKVVGKPPCPNCGTNPINPAVGNKYQYEQDFIGTGSFPLRFERSYNSISAQNKLLGNSWRSNYERSVNLPLSESTAITDVFVQRPDGRSLAFSPSGNNWIPDADVAGKLVQLFDTANHPAGWRYTDSDGDVTETYDVSGKLLLLTSRAGLTQTLLYSDGTASGLNGAIATGTTKPLMANLLLSVTDSFGRQLKFTYDIGGRLVTMTDPSGGVYAYTYGSNTNIQSVTYPDTKTKTYLYNESAYTGGNNLVNALTGILDENGARYATWNYDAQGRAISSEHAGGVE
ncbi:MAG: RHS repeat domain-containing protein, partial [Burkholderiaceae bacterium]